ncbi:DNA cross-link repair protein SNM1-like [Lingula anatina]|uniref:DNA cross-link repair 1A protein n=1 Tax=Lingula anatina TaxID=7574 RepID=A0A1S3HID6_LINAN|nr:DNA cross-link repair protein SNM1-like [Lingula anatina]|eukprot:XP_013385762.1 DNA cross-link repair protein SNM1-like [Lingula anatina]
MDLKPLENRQRLPESCLKEHNWSLIILNVMKKKKSLYHFVEKYLPAEEDIKMPGKIEPNDPTIADIDYMSDEDIFDEKNDTSAEIRNKVEDMLSQETIFKKQNCSRDGSERLNDVSPVNTPSKGFSVDTVFPNSEIEKLFTDEQPWALDIDENCIESSDIPISADSTQHTGGRNSADTQNISTLQTTEGALVECKGQKFTQDVMQTKQTSIYSFFKPSDEIRKQVKYNSASAASKTAKPKDAVSEQQTQRLQRHFLGARSDKSNKERVEENGSVAPIAKGRWKTTCPFYKKIPGTSFTVDAFCYGVVPGCSAYFLSHFHFDHYRGLSKHFKQPIYCSQVTSNLVKKQIRVEDKYLISLPTDRPCHVHGVQVTLMEANHCPGAVLFFFELPNGRAILHTGDFRADPSMVEHPALKGRKIHQLYLDTTYCDPSYAFPPQQDVVSFAVSLAGKHICEHPNSLIVCGTYTIGKERIFIAIAEAIQSRVCVTREKYRILQCLDDNKLDGMLTTKWTEAKVHVLPMGKLKLDTLQEHLRSFKGQFDNILALEPTGWTHSGKTLSLNNIKPKVKKKGITIYGVPYSEHSSYTELKNFVQALQPDQILPTVNNGNPTSRRKMESLFKSWLQEKKVHSQQILLSTWCKN